MYRSLSNIYVQIIDDTTGTTLVSASTIDKEIKALPDSGNKKAEAQLVGKIVGQRALAKGINKVVLIETDISIMDVSRQFPMAPS